MAISENPLFVPGIWGPYYSAMVSGLWLNEGGQSATGKLLDRILEGGETHDQADHNNK
jgi:ribulose kinase